MQLEGSTQMMKNFFFGMIILVEGERQEVKQIRMFMHDGNMRGAPWGRADGQDVVWSALGPAT